MTKSKYMTIAAVAGLLTMLMAFDATAGRGRGRGRGGQGFGKRIAAALELTTEQKTKIQKLKGQMIEDLASTRAKLDQLRGELRDLWAADKPSKKKIMAKHSEMDQHRDKVRERRVQFRLDVLDVLTTEQKAKLKELRARRQGRGNRGGGRGAARGAR
jgi:Spy/CpxP family protein refolding chaperone